jgi:tetratricopeptide (TPR) repeat protein
LQLNGQFERSLDLCERLMAADVEKDLPTGEAWVSVGTMRVKSTSEFYLGRYSDTIATLNELIAKFSYSVEPGIIASAYYNIACAFARLGEVGEAVKSLKKWAEVGGQFESEVVAQDSDFDSVRQHAVFRKLIRSFDSK